MTIIFPCHETSYAGKNHIHEKFAFLIVQPGLNLEHQNCVLGWDFGLSIDLMFRWKMKYKPSSFDYIRPKSCNNNLDSSLQSDLKAAKRHLSLFSLDQYVLREVFPREFPRAVMASGSLHLRTPAI